MPAYLPIDELEVEVGGGKGVSIIVEGQNDENDAWFYGYWFGGRALEVTFHPQDGWPRVMGAVAELRRRCPGMKIYGIVDRDFCDDSALDADFETCGVLRTPRHTIENYLLESGCWAQVFKLIFSRQGHAPDGWDDGAVVQGFIDTAYRSCLPLAAHNWVIQFGNARYSERAALTSEKERSYLQHPKALSERDPVDKLRTWGQQLQAAEDFGDLFEEKHRELEAGGRAVWTKHVSGKHVRRLFCSRFPRAHGVVFPWDHYVNIYLDKCPDPPADLTALVDRILQAAGR